MGSVERNIDLAFDLAKKVAKHPENYPDHFIVLPLDADVIRRVLSDERVRLLRELRDEGPFESVNALAKALGRDQTAVSRDLGELVGHGLVVTERRGKAKRIRAVDRPIVLA